MSFSKSRLEKHMGGRRPSLPLNVPASSTAAPLAPATSLPDDLVHYDVRGLRSKSSNTLFDQEKQTQYGNHDPYSSEKHNGRLASSSSSILTQPISTHDKDLSSPVSRVSTDHAGNVYPEGGTKAYLVVLGSFCGCLISLGLMNTLSTYTAYLENNQLIDHPKSTVGWIFGLYAFLSFFLGLQIGPLFDAYGPRYLVLAGSICILLCYILMAECTQYWHFMLTFSVLGGTGTALVFTPSIAAVGHWFYVRRGTFTGIACVGGSLGGIIFPLTLQALFTNPSVSWAWSQRILALTNLPLAVVANLLIRSRLPPKRPVTKEQILPDPRIFRDPTFVLVTLAVFFLEWGLFVPISYLTSYALSIGVDKNLSYNLVAVFNAGSCFGRWLPGLIADKIGRFNTMIYTTVICLVGVFAFWLPSELISSSSETAQLALFIIFAVVFGFGSGAGISLVPVCVGQLCKTEEYGRYYATCYTVVSFATLTGIPIAGSIVSTTAGQRYWGLILWTGFSYVICTFIFMVAKGGQVGWGKALWTGRF